MMNKKNSFQYSYAIIIINIIIVVVVVLIAMIMDSTRVIAAVRMIIITKTTIKVINASFNAAVTYCVN